jgi:hypothetical protein
LTSKSSTSAPFHLSTSEITAISLGALFAFALLSLILLTFVRIYLIQWLLVHYGLEEQIYNFHSVRSLNFEEIDQLTELPIPTQYKLAINKRTKNYKYNKNKRFSSNASCLSETALVEVSI